MNNRRSFLKLLPLLAAGVMAPRVFAETTTAKKTTTATAKKATPPKKATPAKKPATVKKAAVKKATPTKKAVPKKAAAKKSPEPAPKPAPVKVKESDPPAAALGYRHDTLLVDVEKYPTHRPTQICRNCILYQNKSGATWGECSALSNHQVNANGWCKAYVQRPV